MAGMSATDLQLANRPIAASSSPTSAPAASPQGGAPEAPRQTGFSQQDAFAPSDPVGDYTGQLNSQASGRADLVQGWFEASANLLGTSNRAHGWHKLMMELINLQRPG